MLSLGGGRAIRCRVAAPCLIWPLGLLSRLFGCTTYGRRSVPARRYSRSCREEVPPGLFVVLRRWSLEEYPCAYTGVSVVRTSRRL